MNETKTTQNAKQRVGTSLKVGAVVAVLSLIAITAEQPRLSAGPKVRDPAVSAAIFVPGKGVADESVAAASPGPDVSGPDASASAPAAAGSSKHFLDLLALPQGDGQSPPMF
jgi:hypothetical protein